MSSLAEIEAAVEILPLSEQTRLLEFLTGRMGRGAETPTGTHDPVEEIIGAFSGPREATGRNAEEILYGPRG